MAAPAPHGRAVAIAAVRAAFRDVAFPGNAFLQGSFDGCEPYDEVSQFHDRSDWTALDAEFLDARYCALGFFSEAGFRFFLPAYLVADLEDRLRTADPAFHLTHGFWSMRSTLEVDGVTFAHHLGPDVLLGPRRYGAMTWADQARHRLSVFTREEAGAIVAYLRAKHDAAEEHELTREQVRAALDAFWLERARVAPTAAQLAAHVAEERRHAAALRAKYERG